MLLPRKSRPVPAHLHTIKHVQPPVPLVLLAGGHRHRDRHPVRLLTVAQARPGWLMLQGHEQGRARFRTGLERVVLRAAAVQPLQQLLSGAAPLLGGGLQAGPLSHRGQLRVGAGCEKQQFHRLPHGSVLSEADSTTCW